MEQKAQFDDTMSKAKEHQKANQAAAAPTDAFQKVDREPTEQFTQK